jgi:hypothetical protein
MVISSARMSHFKNSEPYSNGYFVTETNSAAFDPLASVARPPFSKQRQ